MLDLRTLVRQLADGVTAIYEPDGAGFSIEVPVKGDRYQAVSLFADDHGVELLTVVHELDKTAQSTIDKYRHRARRCVISLEPDSELGAYRASVRAHVGPADATREKVAPVLMEVAEIGDGIEKELTGGDVD